MRDSRSAVRHLARARRFVLITPGLLQVTIFNTVASVFVVGLELLLVRSEHLPLLFLGVALAAVHGAIGIGLATFAFRSFRALVQARRGRVHSVDAQFVAEAFSGEPRRARPLLDAISSIYLWSTPLLAVTVYLAIEALGQLEAARKEATQQEDLLGEEVQREMRAAWVSFARMGTSQLTGTGRVVWDTPQPHAEQDKHMAAAP